MKSVRLSEYYRMLAKPWLRFAFRRRSLKDGRQILPPDPSENDAIMILDPRTGGTTYIDIEEARYEEMRSAWFPEALTKSEAIDQIVARMQWMARDIEANDGPRRCGPIDATNKGSPLRQALTPAVKEFVRCAWSDDESRAMLHAWIHATPPDGKDPQEPRTRSPLGKRDVVERLQRNLGEILDKLANAEKERRPEP